MATGHYGSFSDEEILKVIWDRPNEVRSDTHMEKATELRAVREITGDILDFCLILCTHTDFVSERHILNLLDWLKQENGKPDFDKLNSLRRMRVTDLKREMASLIKQQQKQGEFDLLTAADIMTRVLYNKFWNQDKNRLSVTTSYLAQELKTPLFTIMATLNLMSEKEVCDVASALNCVWEFVHQTNQIVQIEQKQIKLF